MWPCGIQSKSRSHVLMALRAWPCIVRLLGPQILALSKQILNPLLKVRPAMDADDAIMPQLSMWAKQS